jgi:hypothetical protein
VSPMELTSSRSLIVLRLSSALAALLTLIQAVLVILTAAKVAKLIGAHGGVGYLSLLATITATIAAYVWFRKGGSKGLVMHAGGVAVLMLVQIGLGEAKVAPVHIALGILIVLGVGALAMLAYRKPGGAV